jgi:2-dehydro-3-deoxyglucarate aldolase/4-hydroxy-2-oxoheptanedioate aldolase
MDLPLNGFKRGLTRTPPMLGTWLMTASTPAAEALGCLGFDFLVVDMEHVAIDVPQALGMLQAIAATPAQSLVRVPWNDPVLVKRVLDAGATSVMFPMIESAEEARLAAQSCRYPPKGSRGVALVNRGSRYGTVKDYGKRANDEICCVVQLETPRALSRLKEIAAIDGVDSLFIGPGDLAASMGQIGNLTHEAVQKALAEGAEAARKAGKPVGIVGPTPEIVKRYLEYGFTWVAVASDMAMMTRVAGEYLAAMRGGPAPAKPQNAY